MLILEVRNRWLAFCGPDPPVPSAHARADALTRSLSSGSLVKRKLQPGWRAEGMGSGGPPPIDMKLVVWASHRAATRRNRGGAMCPGQGNLHGSWYSSVHVVRHRRAVGMLLCRYIHCMCGRCARAVWYGSWWCTHRPTGAIPNPRSLLSYTRPSSRAQWFESLTSCLLVSVFREEEEEEEADDDDDNDDDDERRRLSPLN